MAKPDKTEQPTPKKLRESRQKGQIAKSQDLTAWASVLIGLYLIPLTVGRMAEAGASSFNHIATMSPETTAQESVGIFGEALVAGFVAVAPLMAAAFASSFIASILQTGPLLTLKPLKPDFKKINPKNGFQRLFSGRSLWEVGKQLIKMAVIIGAAYPRASTMFDDMIGEARPEFGAALRYAGEETLAVIQTVAWAMLAISLLDYTYQKYATKKDLKMTKQEVKDEMKNTEGDAMVKGRIRSLQRDMARNRMLADIGNADVVITNPTHIAVALHYDADQGGAPKVLAVGAGAVAAKIREAALDHDVPMVEAKPLARALWRACEVGDEVPVALYEAVAKVLVFVRRLDRRFRRRHPIDLPPDSAVDEAFLESIPRKKRRRR
ncbi:MAG: flagellar biosynthesis protein FlhB [Actinomycetota bacterium]